MISPRFRLSPPFVLGTLPSLHREVEGAMPVPRPSRCEWIAATHCSHSACSRASRDRPGDSPDRRCRTRSNRSKHLGPRRIPRSVDSHTNPHGSSKESSGSCEDAATKRRGETSKIPNGRSALGLSPGPGPGPTRHSNGSSSGSCRRTHEWSDDPHPTDWNRSVSPPHPVQGIGTRVHVP